MNPTLALTRHALAEAFRGKRRYGLALLALAPAFLAAALNRWGTGAGEQEAAFVAFGVGVGLVVPLIALWIGTASLREELTSGTIVHLVTKPVPRSRLLWTRLVGAALATTLMAGVGISLVFPALGASSVDALGTVWLVTALASLAYTSLFALFGALLDRGVLAGLAYLVGWEGIVAGTDLVFRKATISHWSDSIVAQQGLGPGGLLGGGVSDPASTVTAVAVLVGIGLVAGFVGAAWFSRREFAGPEPG